MGATEDRPPQEPENGESDGAAAAVGGYTESAPTTAPLTAGVGRLRSLIEFCGRHPFATGVFAILSGVGFVLAVIDFRIAREEAEATTTQVDRVEQKVDQLIVPPAPPPDIVGSWDPKRAEDLAWLQLNRHRQRITEELGEPVFVTTLFDRYLLKAPRSESRLLLYASRPDDEKYDCHACGYTFHALVFDKVEAGWKLSKVGINAFEAGEYGRLPEPESIRALSIGDGNVGLVVEVYGGNMGDFEGWSTLYAFIDESMVEVLNLQTRYKNLNRGDPDSIFADTPSWSATIEVVPVAGSAFFDLRVRRDGDPGFEQSDGVLAEELLRFDGRRYATATTFR